MSIIDYSEFLERKAQIGMNAGFDPVFMPDQAFDFQSGMIEFSVKKGRVALFEDCGLGKTLQELAWCENVHRKTNKPVLLLTPLAVSAQTIREAEKFGIEAGRSIDGRPFNGITVTNYERLHYFDWQDFGGVCCDESSILKSFNGARKTEITEFMKKIQYRLLATATAAPNDYIELGTSSEALGHLGYVDMLNRFFKNDQNNSTNRGMYGQRVQWRFKGHAQQPYWRWVCSWARALRKPSDLGFCDDGFVLPPLLEKQHIVQSRTMREGMLFSLPAADLREQREERKLTIQERCERVAELTEHDDPVLIWCHLNEEGKALENMIADAVQIAGSDRDEKKEERFLAFANGEARVLITKPKIGAWGLNFQHCAHVITFPSHSFEQYYQSIRRCWRFGQKRSVRVDIVSTEGEEKVLQNLQRKARQADEMFASLVEEMNDAIFLNSRREFSNQMEVPAWL